MLALKGFLQGSWIARMLYSHVCGFQSMEAMTLSRDFMVLCCKIVRVWCPDIKRWWRWRCLQL